MNDYRDQNLINRLLDAVPELRPGYDVVLKHWDGEQPGLHNVLGELLNPHIEELLEGSASNAQLVKVFGFVEELARHAEQHVQEVAGVTVVENLLRNKRWLARAREYMGPFTLAISNEMERDWG